MVQPITLPSPKPRNPFARFARTRGGAGEHRKRRADTRRELQRELVDLAKPPPRP